MFYDKNFIQMLKTHNNLEIIRCQYFIYVQICCVFLVSALTCTLIPKQPKKWNSQK